MTLNDNNKHESVNNHLPAAPLLGRPPAQLSHRYGGGHPRIGICGAGQYGIRHTVLVVGQFLGRFVATFRAAFCDAERLFATGKRLSTGRIPPKTLQPRGNTGAVLDGHIQLLQFPG